MARHDIRDYMAGCDPETLSANARKGGLKSGENARRYRSFKETLKALMEMDVEDPETRKKLEAMGQLPTYGNALNLAVLVKGTANGDVEAARFIRDSVGEKPREKYDLGIENKPVKSLDLSKLTDEELEALADRAGE